jgi:hypothetical protein
MGTNAPAVEDRVTVSGDIEDIETALDTRHKAARGELEFLDLDLSNCVFLQLATMAWLVALLNAREQKSLQTIIRLPRSKSVRDFMAVWEFPRAVRDAVGRPFEDFLRPDDQTLFLEEQALEISKLQYAGKVLKSEGIEQRLLSEGFFEFNTFVPQKMAHPQRLAAHENARWREDRILSVLSKHLRGPATTVSSHIVHEAIMNALRHPKCRLIQTASYFDRPKSYLLTKQRGIAQWHSFFSRMCHDRTFGLKTPAGRIWELLPSQTRAVITEGRNGIPTRSTTELTVLEGLNTVLSRADFYDESYFPRVVLPEELKGLLVRDPPTMSPKLTEKRNRQLLELAFGEEISHLDTGHLTITFWDDGDSMVDTLLGAIRSRKPVRSVAIPGLSADFDVTIQDENGEKAEPILIRSDLNPDETTPGEIVFLAATFPGITRDVSGAGHVTDPSVSATDPRLGFPGMGLYVLTNQAVEVYGGSVSIRSKNYFLNIKGHDGERSAGDAFCYAAKVRRFGDWCPTFQGNMLTVRLPLR